MLRPIRAIWESQLNQRVVVKIPSIAKRIQRLNLIVRSLFKTPEETRACDHPPSPVWLVVVVVVLMYLSFVVKLRTRQPWVSWVDTIVFTDTPNVQETVLHQWSSVRIYFIQNNIFSILKISLLHFGAIYFFSS